MSSKKLSFVASTVCVTAAVSQFLSDDRYFDLFLSVIICASCLYLGAYFSVRDNHLSIQAKEELSRMSEEALQQLDNSLQSGRLNAVKALHQEVRDLALAKAIVDERSQVLKN